MNPTHLIAALALGFLLGCGQAPTKPSATSSQVALLPSTTALDGGSIKTQVGNVDLTKYHFAYLDTPTDLDAPSLEALVRGGLADLGLPRMVGKEEIERMAQQIPAETSGPFPVARALSEKAGRFLAIQFSSLGTPDQREVRAIIVDAQTAQKLFEAVHRTIIDRDADQDAHNPMLNALRRWVTSNRSGDQPS